MNYNNKCQTTVPIVLYHTKEFSVLRVPSNGISPEALPSIPRPRTISEHSFPKLLLLVSPHPVPLCKTQGLSRQLMYYFFRLKYLRNGTIYCNIQSKDDIGHVFHIFNGYFATIAFFRSFACVIYAPV